MVTPRSNGVFMSHSYTQQTVRERLRVKIELETRTGLSPILGSVLKSGLSTTLGLAALSLTGVGWVSRPKAGSEEPEEIVYSLFVITSANRTLTKIPW